MFQKNVFKVPEAISKNIHKFAWMKDYGCREGLVTWEALNASFYAENPDLIEHDGYRGFIYEFVDCGDYIEMR